MGLIPVFIVGLISLSGCGERQERLSHSIHRPHPQERASIAPDVEIAATGSTSFPEEKRLREIIAIGARALTWKQALEQALSSSGEEGRSSKSTDDVDQASPENPDKYSQATAIETFDRAWAKLPSEAQRVLKGRGRLPEQAPVEAGQEKAFLKTLGKITLARGDALRFMDLYPDRNKWYSAEKNDFRIWMRVRDNLASYRADVQFWTGLGWERQKAGFEEMRQLCVLVGFGSSERCAELFALSSGPRDDLADLFENLVEKGVQYEDSILGVSPNHNVIKGRAVPGVVGALALEVSTFDVSSSLLNFFRGVVKSYWERADLLSFRVTPSMVNMDGVMFLSLRSDVVAHVTKTNVRRDTIVLDDARSIESEAGRSTLAHEFGHVLGFADCYVEFWDETEKAFLYYDIDPENLMCNSRGHVLERHVQDLLKKFAPTPTWVAR